MSAEERNAQQIEALNQRGGRTLSIVDLIQANTIGLDMAAHCFFLAAHGASFLAAARPGGAGKTTLLGCLLNFIAPGTEIITVSDPGVIQRVQEDQTDSHRCLLAHEIGSGSWFGYIWDEYVGVFLEAMSHSCAVASCIHADTIDEIEEILTSPGLDVPLDVFRSIELICFMHVESGPGGYRRRVSALYESAAPEEPHRLLFDWDRNTDTFRSVNEPNLLKRICAAHGMSKAEGETKLRGCKELIERLVAEDARSFQKVRQETAAFLIGAT